MDLVVTVTVEINGLHNNADTYITELGTHGGLRVCASVRSCVFSLSSHCDIFSRHSYFQKAFQLFEPACWGSATVELPFSPCAYEDSDLPADVTVKQIAGGGGFIFYANRPYCFVAKIAFW